ncbi:MAG: PAS domain S-box protein [Methanomicrobiaceae archaeon]|nr:PAS domain S-box protein [Methanomicrobiaceae archaeon]MDD5418753.1 PAS domain S-box protein [Methanomicrobiaceae archaeon]
MINVLLVDGNREFLDEIRRSLETGDGVTVKTASSPRAAVHLIREQNIDAIVSGADLPAREWTAALQALREQGIDLPFFLFAGNGNGRLAIQELRIQAEFPCQTESAPEGEAGVLIRMIRQAVERRDAFEKLRKENEMMNAILMTSPAAMCLVQGGVITWTNRKMHAFLGYDEGSLTGRNALMLFPSAEEYHRVAAEFEEKADRQEWGHTECKLRRRDGSLICVHLQARSIDPEDPGKGYVVLGQDVTEHKRLKELLKRSEVRYQSLVENANSIILRMDPQGTIQFINRYAELFFGYRAEEVLGKHVVGTIVPRKGRSGRDLAAMIEDMGQNPEAYEIYINENLLKSGERVWVAWTNKAIYDRDGRVTGILCIGNDITDRKIDIRDPRISIEPWKSSLIEGTDIEESTFEAAFEIAVEISREGREGKPVGTAFLIGDAPAVLAQSRQLILNPFEGHADDLRMVTSPDLKETIKELSQLDGAFVISGSGIVEAAGRYITIDTSATQTPKGMGTRHASVAAITRAARAVGIVVSQSGGRISIFRDGRPVKIIAR